MGLKLETKIVIGWDVRGWMSKQQATAVLAVNGNQIDWLGSAERFGFAPEKPLGLASLLKQEFCWP